MGIHHFLGCWAIETSFLIPQATRRTIQLDRPDFTQRFLLVSIFYIFSASFLGFPVPWSRTIHLLAGWAFETSLLISKTTPRAIQLDQLILPNDFYWFLFSTSFLRLNLVFTSAMGIHIFWVLGFWNLFPNTSSYTQDYTARLSRFYPTISIGFYFLHLFCVFFGFSRSLISNNTSFSRLSFWNLFTNI